MPLPYVSDSTALWAADQVTRLLMGTPADLVIPEYGADEWARLGPRHPVRFASVVTAAEQWRCHLARERHLAHLAETDGDAWYKTVFGPADTAAHQVLRREPLSRRPTMAELTRRRSAYPPTVPVTATPEWGPVAIPGHPGWWRHHIDGQQVDLPTRTPSQTAVMAA